jgi:hypothetical protein
VCARAISEALRRERILKKIEKEKATESTVFKSNRIVNTMSRLTKDGKSPYGSEVSYAGYRDKIKTSIQNGYPVIATIGSSLAKMGHYVVIGGYESTRDGVSQQ